MKTQNLVAEAKITIDASTEDVWEALTDPKQIEKYMFGAKVETDWKTGSKITWTGEMDGKSYIDKGKIVEIKRNEVLKYTHFSPLSGLKDAPENYHNIRIELKEKDSKTEVVLSQDNNPTEASKGHSQENWGKMLKEMKALLEK